MSPTNEDLVPVGLALPPLKLPTVSPPRVLSKEDKIYISRKLDSFARDRWQLKTGDRFLQLPSEAIWTENTRERILTGFHLLRNHIAVRTYLHDWRYLGEDGAALASFTKTINKRRDDRQVRKKRLQVLRANRTRARKRRAPTTNDHDTENTLPEDVPINTEKEAGSEQRPDQRTPREPTGPALAASHTTLESTVPTPQVQSIPSSSHRTPPASGFYPHSMYAYMAGMPMYYTPYNHGGSYVHSSFVSPSMISPAPAPSLSPSRPPLSPSKRQRALSIDSPAKHRKT